MLRSIRGRLLALVVLVDAGAVLVLAVGGIGGLADRPGTVVLLAAVATLAGIPTVRISSLGTEVTATHPFILCGLSTAGFPAAGIIALAGALGSIVGHWKSQRGIKVAFNLGGVVLSSAMATGVFFLAGGRPGVGVLEVIWPLAAATATYFLANTGLVAVAVSMEREQKFALTWDRSFRWTAVSFLTGLPVAVALLAIQEKLGPWGLVLGLPPCWLILAYYRSHKSNLEEQERRIAVVEELNSALEQRVEDRTRQLKQALDRVEELQALKETLTQTVIHDLKNPLTAVVGNFDLVEDHGDERARTYARRGKSEASRMLRMMMNLMDVAAMEEGRFTVRCRNVDTVSIVRQAVEHAAVAAAQHEVRLVVRAADPACSVSGDAAVLQRIIDNLLANALQHAPRGSTVTVGVERRRGKVEISVADQGPGIPAEFREKIFEKYNQGEADRQNPSENRGLGLTFCQLAVLAHEGTIRVEDAPAGGALFRVVLPHRSPAGESTRTPAPRATL